MELTEALLVAVPTGAASSVATIAALRVHVAYLKEALTDIERRLTLVESKATKAHSRVDVLEVRLSK